MAIFFAKYAWFFHDSGENACCVCQFSWNAGLSRAWSSQAAGIVRPMSMTIGATSTLRSRQPIKNKVAKVPKAKNTNKLNGKVKPIPAKPKPQTQRAFSGWSSVSVAPYNHSRQTKSMVAPSLVSCVCAAMPYVEINNNVDESANIFPNARALGSPPKARR